jgi:hypothetical protein
MCGQIPTLNTSDPSSSSSLQTYFRDKKHPSSVLPPSSTPKDSIASVSIAPPPSTDPFQLPVGANLQGLTKSQRLFSVATRIDVRSLTISTDDEFYLFMAMRAERGWASFKMTAHKWVTETDLYNTRLEEVDRKASRTTVRKNPRALMDQLIAIEVKVIERLASGNYKCKHFSTYIISFMNNADPHLLKPI